jgi:hypothetical protein
MLLKQEVAFATRLIKEGLVMKLLFFMLVFSYKLTFPPPPANPSTIEVLNKYNAKKIVVH